MPGGDLSLKIENGLRSVVRLVDPGQAQRRRDMLAILVPEHRVGLEPIVGLVRQPEAALADEHHVAVGITWVRLGFEGGQPRDGSASEAAHQGHQLGDGGNAVDFGQQRSKRCGPSLLDGRFVHETRVQVGDLRRLAAGLARCQLGDDLSDGLFGLITQRDERAGDWFVLRNLRVGQPAPVDVAEEIILNSDFGVEIVHLQGGTGAHQISHSVDASPIHRIGSWCAQPV